jgi:histidinol-phosphate/aromatic aminotransferase/cobyric acid decarboxylase-like protein
VADDADRFRSRQPTWSVNGLALALLPQLLDRADLPYWRQAIDSRRDELAALLQERGYRPLPSDAPWLLVDAPGLRERLIPRRVVVRDCANFGLAGHVRIAVPDDAGMDHLHQVLPHFEEAALT